MTRVAVKPVLIDWACRRSGMDLAQLEARFKALEWEGKEHIRDGAIAGIFRSQRIAFWGLAFVALGSLCQSLAAWLTATYSATSAPPG